MKAPLQNLLIACALGLCALCAWQWHLQVRQHRELQSFAQTKANQTADLQHATNSLALVDLKVAQQDAQLRELLNTVQSNRAELRALRGETNRLASALAQTKATVEMQIQQANTAIRQQTAALSNLVVQRDDFWKRLNETMEDRNAVVTKYNELVKRLAESPTPPAKPGPASK